ncbi:citrate synthase [Pontibacillus litoralis]|uniref:Citrate synthase n=1 Tax=Pontibacillus litoralis JSM 072002 TaxID=1385512 RepID=A0A0A5G2R5_9BACI|nr:citrate synthase [Pontibacillus litoralis]KGX87381.1 citrate synthase [Pontibacillus litoralis JSM 072002]
MEEQITYKPGLNGVIAAETCLSYLDVDAEEIVIKGYDLIELAQSVLYIDLIHLFLQGSLPTEQEQVSLEKELVQAYHLPSDILAILKQLPHTTHPMDALRTSISTLASYDEQLDIHNEVETRQKTIHLLAKIPNIVANSYHILHNKQPILPREDLAYSTNFLYMITGHVPNEREAAIFDQSLMVYSEHEMPNSTFTARVIASTNADIYGALTGAVASLKGNLHGGANEAVMYMLLEGKTVDGYRNLLYNKLQQKEKVMGFGHRVYMKKMDPRAALMKEALRELATEKGEAEIFEMCEAGEQIMKEEKGLYPNLDYYAAPVYYLLGIPIPLYTPIFFAARTLGLSAHVAEQQQNNKLFRPRVRYTGPRGLHP